MLANGGRRIFMFLDTLMQMPACESNITRITQVTFKFVNKTLLVQNVWLSFTQLKILFDLVADKYGLNSNMNLLAQIFELIAKNVS